MTDRFKNFLSLSILFPIAGWMLSLSWQKWPDLLVDYGKELYVAWQISNGMVLYRDIAYFHGPLSSYLNAFLFKIFGVHLMTLAIFNIVLIFILTVLIFRVFFKTTDRITATAVSVTFLAVFAFSQYVFYGNYNFVCPYTYNLTYGIFLAFLLIDCYLIYLNSRKEEWLLGMGGVLGLIFLCKTEVFFASAIAIVMGLWFVKFIDRLSLSNTLRTLSLFCLGFLVPILLFVIYFSYHMPFSKAVASIVFPYKVIFNPKIFSNIFYRHVMGSDLLTTNLLRLVLAAVGYLFLVLDLALINFGIRRFSRHNFLIFGTLIIVGLLFLLKLCLISMGAWGDVFRPLPMVILGFGVYFLYSLLSDRKALKESNRLMGLLVMSVFAFLLLLKMALNVHVYHYGFALAMPAVLLFAGVLIYQMPILLGKDTKERSVIRFFSLILLGVFLVAHINISKNIYKLKTYAVGSGLDTIYDFNPKISLRGLQTQLALNQIEKIIKKNESFVVFPEGVMLNYLTKRLNPTPYLNFMPAELITFGEQETLNSFIKNSPDYIILVDKDLSEYGCSASSSNCGNNILNWINQNYTPVVKIGNRPLISQGFGIWISQRNANL